MIPTYEPNPAYLRETIESVLHSGLAADARQLAIVDDASRSPEFGKLADEMRERGVEIIRCDQEAGLPGNWNRCLNFARGHWVHLLHQDDKVRPGFYAALQAGIDTEPRIGAAFSQVAFIDSSGRELRVGSTPTRDAGILHDWVERIFVDLSVQCPCIAVRRTVYERLGGYDATFRYCSDYDMWQRIAAEYPIWHEPAVLAEYREHGGSATSRFDLPYRWRERFGCLEKGLPRLSPAIRQQVSRSGRRVFLKLAYHEKAIVRRGLNPGQQLAALYALSRSGDISDHLSIWRRRRPRVTPGRAPARDADPALPRRPRILVVSEFFPGEPDIAVFGGHQRLQRHLDASNRVGHLDAVFLWSGKFQLSPNDMEEVRLRLQPSWPIAGNVVVIATEPGPSRISFKTIRWMLRGAVSFFHMQPMLGVCGQLQAMQMREAIRTFQPDLIFAHRLGAMGALIRSGQQLPPVVLDIDDLEHIRLARMGLEERGLRSWFRRFAWVWIARHVERVAARLAFVSLVCSEHDRAILSAMVPGARLEVLPNGTRDAALSPLPPAPTAMFVGVATYPPNAAAIRSLVIDIWPRVRRLVPTAELTIVGYGALAVAECDSDSGISVVDFISDLSGIYRDARIALCPIRHGGGTRVKIIEAAMHARPVVSTRLGAEGLAFVPGTEILIADEPEAFAEACATLLLDSDRCQKIGDAAWRRAMEEYSHERIVARLANILTGVLEKQSSLKAVAKQP